MIQKIKVGAVSYLNAKPLLYGLKHTDIIKEIVLTEDYPSNIAHQLLHGTIDIGLVPVAIIPKLQEHYIISNYCIGCDGEVASVCLFSEVPIEQIKKVLLDYQSRTSVRLVQILLKEYWKVDVVFEQTSTNFREEIKNTTAAVVIGDRAFEQRNISTYCYDVGLAWKQHTGLPFVFAAWVANKPLNEDFIARFSAANQLGLDDIETVIHQLHSPHYNLKKYFTQNIQYVLNNNLKKGLAHFLEKI
ncbi:MAG TPA: menaquinone biosynthesis protein [Chitinophagaceae bacterium]|nr:menaquinone biosynthesis protein [Chitinophagaceae bacterium]